MKKTIIGIFILAISVIFVTRFSHSPIDDAISAIERPLSDQVRDELRKPEEVLTFFGLQSGMKVFDLFSGGGYYSEIVSRAIGPEGQVISHNNQAYLNLAEKELAKRQLGNRLPNNTSLVSEGNDITLEADSLDMVLMVLTYHDFYYVDNGWLSIDAPRLLTEIFKGLRPGGVVGIVDHVAELGSGTDAAQTLHRIEPDVVRTGMEAVGFIFDGEIDVLINPQDPLNIPMFQKSIRGKTSRFVYRFKKPLP